MVCEAAYVDRVWERQWEWWWGKKVAAVSTRGSSGLKALHRAERVREVLSMPLEGGVHLHLAVRNM